MEPEQLVSNVSKNTQWTYQILVIILSAAVTGGAVFAIQTKQNADTKNNLQTQVNSLKSQLAVLSTASPVPVATAAPLVTLTPTATATPDPTAGWKTYSDTNSGLSFKYPSTLVLNNTSTRDKGWKGLDFTVTSQLVSTMPDAPLWYGPDVAKAEMAALAKGDISQTHHGEKLLSLSGGATGATSLGLQLLTCDSIGFTRQAHIYRNGYQIIISLSDTDVSTIKANNPAYFGIDPSCSDSEQIFTEPAKFATDLAAGKTDSESQNWYTTFQKVLNTVAFN